MRRKVVKDQHSSFLVFVMVELLGFRLENRSLSMQDDYAVVSLGKKLVLGPFGGGAMALDREVASRFRNGYLKALATILKAGEVDFLRRCYFRKGTRRQQDHSIAYFADVAENCSAADTEGVVAAGTGVFGVRVAEIGEGFLRFAVHFEKIVDNAVVVLENSLAVDIANVVDNGAGAVHAAVLAVAIVDYVDAVVAVVAVVAIVDYVVVAVAVAVAVAVVDAVVAVDAVVDAVVDVVAVVADDVLVVVDAVAAAVAAAVDSHSRNCQVLQVATACCDLQAYLSSYSLPDVH